AGVCRCFSLRAFKPPPSPPRLWVWDVALKKCDRTRGPGKPAAPNRPVRALALGGGNMVGAREAYRIPKRRQPPLVHNMARSTHRAVTPGRPAPEAGA